MLCVFLLYVCYLILFTASNWHEFFRRVLVVAKNSLALRQQSTLDNANTKQLWISGLLLLLLIYVMEQAFLDSGFLFIWYMKFLLMLREANNFILKNNTNNDIKIGRFGCKDSTCPANLCRELCRGKPGSSSMECTQGTQGIFT